MGLGQVRTATVVGTATEAQWSQAEVVMEKGVTYAALCSLVYSGDSDLIDLPAVGSSLLSQILQAKELKEDIVEDLDETLEASLLFAKIDAEGMVISTLGKVSVLIYRKDKVGEIVKPHSSPRTLTGILMPQDVLLLSSDPLRRVVTGESIRTLLSQGIEAQEELAVRVRGQADSGGMAGVLVYVGEDNHIVQDKPARLSVGEVVHGWMSRFRIEKPLYIAPEKRQKNLWIGSILLTLLFVGVVIGVIRRGYVEQERMYTDLVTSVEQKIAEAKSIGDLNPGRAKILLAESDQAIDAYLSHKRSDTYKGKALQLKTMIQTTETEVFKRQQTTLTTLVELNVLRPGMQAELFFLDGSGNVMLPDTRSRSIVVVGAEDKSSYVINPSGLGEIRELGMFNRTLYGLQGDGVWEITQKESKKVIEPDDLWGEAYLLDLFAGNVYVFDKGQGEIWKYPALEDGFGTRRRWLAAGIQPDLSKVIDMKVDGDVWLLTSSGKVAHYSRGVPVDFTMEGFPTATGDTLSAPRALFVVEDLVYVLEAGASRVVVFNTETGTYERQYAAQEFGEAKDLVVTNGKGYVLLPDRIAWFAL